MSLLSRRHRHRRRSRSGSRRWDDCRPDACGVDQGRPKKKLPPSDDASQGCGEGMRGTRRRLVGGSLQSHACWAVVCRSLCVGSDAKRESRDARSCLGKAVGRWWWWWWWREEIVDFWGETGKRDRDWKGRAQSLLSPPLPGGEWRSGTANRSRIGQVWARMGRTGPPWTPPSPSPRLGLLGVLAAWGGTGGPCVPLWSPRLFTLSPMRQGDRGVARRARPLWCGTRGNFSVGEREWARDPPLAGITHGEAWRWAARSERTGGSRQVLDNRTGRYPDKTLGRRRACLHHGHQTLSHPSTGVGSPTISPFAPISPSPARAPLLFLGIRTLAWEHCARWARDLILSPRSNHSYPVSPSTASVGMSSRFQPTRLNTGRTFHSSRPVHAMRPLNFRQEEQHTNTNAHNSGFHIHDIIAICLIRPPPQPNEP